MPSQERMITDEMIVAVLDGEADQDLREAVEDASAADPVIADRIDMLAAGSRPFADAYDLMLDHADHNHLNTLLKRAEMIAQPDNDTQPAEPPSNVIPWRRLTALAAMLVVGVGVGLGGAYFTQPDTQTTQVGWRQAVADYQALYTRDTLDLARQSRTQQADILATVSGKLGRELTLDNVALDGLSYRRAQILDFKGKPLAQLAYMAGEDRPIALCIVASDKPAKAMQTETRNGLNIAFWSDGTHAYMIIGDMDEQALKTHAASLQAGLVS